MVRHGITETNATRKFTGQTDVDLNEEGYRQVANLRDRLADEKIDIVYSSDLKRALVTAEPISISHGLEVIRCPELRELDYGKCEGMTYREINDRYPELGKLIAEVNPEMRFPEGECFQDLTDRAEKFIEIVGKYGEDESILAVSHGGMIRTLICRLLGLELSYWSSFRIDNASLTIIDIYSRRTIISLLNDTSHLREIGA
jgi:alpha-ribazole phosphatase